MSPQHTTRLSVRLRAPRTSLSRVMIAAASLCVIAAAPAAEILWIDCVNTTSNAGEGRPPSAGWLELLETTGGHSVTTFDSSTYLWSLADQASKDYVNSFDVVIVTRTNNSFNTIRAFGANWKTVSAPMIEMNPYMVGGQFSSGSWSWLASGAGSANTGGSTAVPTDVANPADPIWTGVTLENGGTQAPNLFAAASGNWFWLNGNPLRDGISVVASNPADSTRILIAYAEPGALSATSGPRYYFNWGTDNTLMNYNDDGKLAFLNAIKVLTGGFAPAEFSVTIARNTTTPGTYDFSWNSRAGKVYDLLTSTDLSTPIVEWPIYQSGPTLYQAISSAGETTTLSAVPAGGERRFFVVSEYDAPPLLLADFEANDGGFTATAAAGSPWDWGAPASNGVGGSVTTGNGNSTRCWGTNITSPGAYALPTTTVLRSPVIDLGNASGATLTFAQALDIASGDVAQVFLVNADTNADIGPALLTVTDSNITNANWASVSPVNLAAGAGLRVFLEWRFHGEDPAGDYLGWYIDDVRVEATTL